MDVTDIQYVILEKANYTTNFTKFVIDPNNHIWSNLYYIQIPSIGNNTFIDFDTIIMVTP